MKFKYYFIVSESVVTIVSKNLIGTRGTIHDTYCVITKFLFGNLAKCHDQRNPIRRDDMAIAVTDLCKYMHANKWIVNFN